MSVEAMQKVSPEDGLKVLKNTAHPIYRAFQGQGDSPASAIPVAIAGYENALYEIDRLRAELEQERAAWFRTGVRRVTVCLGCGMPVEADCGCPAGTYEQLVNRRAETAEARVRELEKTLRTVRAGVELMREQPGPECPVSTKRNIVRRIDNALANREKG